MSNVTKQIFEDKPDIKAYLKSDNSEIKVSSVDLNTEGQIVYVTDESGNKTQVEDTTIVSNFLPVPGVGYLKPGTVVEYLGCKYVLLFGWHTNVSNQKIYSWFLRETNSDVNTYDYSEYKYMSRSEVDPFITDHTLYYDMIDQLNNFTCC